MSTPEWLTQAYVERALRTFHKDDALKINELLINPALAPGENYGAVLTRLCVKYELSTSKETISSRLIVKTMIDDDEFSQEVMAPYDIYNREMTIYEDVLPKLNALLQEINDSEKIFPTAVYVDKEKMAIIFEDLVVKGYVMADRIKRLDMEHVKLILRKLAKYHATTAVLNERNNGCLESYDRGFFNRYTDSYSGYFVGGLLACARWLSQLPECVQYAKKLFALAPHYMEIGKRCFEPTPGHVNVLAHGDVWTNNVMFKYDEQTRKPIDLILIDFQYSFWGSPTIDLHHLFNTSLQESLRRQQQSELLRFYHKYFTSTLKKLTYKQNTVPSLHQFSLQAEQKSFFALHSTFVVQPVMINEDPTDADFNALMADDERATGFKNRLYNNNPTVQKNIKELAPVFDHKGLLEANQCS